MKRIPDTRQWLTLLLWFLGFELWLALPYDYHPTWIAGCGLVLASCVASINLLNRTTYWAMMRITRKLQSHPAWATVGAGTLAFAYLMLQAWHRRGEEFLRLHDEHSYRIQAQMLAHGRLWMHAYPSDVSPFFDSFHLIVDRVYASIYFPGTALAMVPSIWLGLPYWITPLVCGAAATAFFYCIVAELFDPLRAVIAVLLLLSLYHFHEMSLMLMSETPFLLSAMILVWTWLRWRRRKSVRWAMLMGAAAGWAAIIRPLDAACFAAAIAAAILFELRGQWRILLKTAAAAVLATLPFIALQITQNIGVTGKWTQTPMQYYVSEYYPAPIVGFNQVVTNKYPPGISAAKKAYLGPYFKLYTNHTLGRELSTWFSGRFNQLRIVTLPSSGLVMFFPLALATLWDIRRLTLIAALILFLFAYLAYIFKLDHYLIPTIPAIICIVLMGWEALERAWPRWRRRTRTFFVIVVAALALEMMPEFNRHTQLILTICEQAKQIGQDLSTLPAGSVVLFPFNPDRIAVDCFPVYNDEIAWPDDAAVIRAGDLGDNRKLYAYYARIQPQRRFYRYSRASDDDKNPVTFLGTARDLAATSSGR